MDVQATLEAIDLLNGLRNRKQLSLYGDVTTVRTKVSPDSTAAQNIINSAVYRFSCELRTYLTGWGGK